ncbi:MAG: hypothetical protein U1E25_01070 [Methylocystis sp.]
MSKYLDRLHALEKAKSACAGNCQNRQKPFGSSVSMQEGHFSGPQAPLEPAPIPAVVSLDHRRACIEAIYARMDAERERRRDWWAQPVDDPPGRLTIRNIARDETVVVDLRKWRSGR